MPKLVIPTAEEMVREVFNDPKRDKTVLSKLVADLPKDIRLEGISAEDILEQLPPDQLAKLMKLAAQNPKQTDNPVPSDS